MKLESSNYAEADCNEVEEVQFTFMTTEEVQRHSVVKITNPSIEPTPGGLYDPAMGPIANANPSLCVTCGKYPDWCNGHFGHIDLVSTAYNPLLFDMLHTLLQRTCFRCLKFRSGSKKVKKCLIKLIAKRLVIEGRSLDDSTLGNGDDALLDQLVQKADGSVYSSAEDHMVILKTCLGIQEKCEYCEYLGNSKITKPTFGCLRLVAESSESKQSINEDIIMISKLGRDESMDDTQDSALSSYILPSEARAVVKRLFENEAPLCSFIAEIQRKQLGIPSTVANHLMFFLDAVLVPPIKFRSPAGAGENVEEHSHTHLLRKILQSNRALGEQATRSHKIRQSKDLQERINILYDSKRARPNERYEISGIRQLLEKREGIIRQNMMGKNVNFACRSVISPDPYLAVNEIGIPPYFAQRLTYPERVTNMNVAELRDAVCNGPEVHPGASVCIDSVSTRKIPQGTDPKYIRKRKTMAKRLSFRRGSGMDPEDKFVLRHIRDGDIVLVNRQPTLHKQNIMAHVVRILKGEKTLRMHYANCSSYNANFDGDEMNVHFPQDEISRAEGYLIVNANEQCIEPTKGDIVWGLVQDHIVSALLLTRKDTFLTLEEFNQLRYESGIFLPGTASGFGKSSSKKGVTEGSVREVTECTVPYIPPAVWKPKKLWTGKQVITSLLNHLTRGCPPCNVEKATEILKHLLSISKDCNVEKATEIPKHLLSISKDEYVCTFHRNDFVCGVIDEAQFGQFGLVHTVQELYGSHTAGLLLSALSRVCIMFSQFHGFTFDIGDLCISPHVGKEVHNFRRGQIGHKKLPLEVGKVISGDREIGTADLDMEIRLTKRAEKMSKGPRLKGLLKPFPKDCISLMTVSGAKGSTLELEDKRIPIMGSGKTCDSAAKAGGYSTGCFRTGLRDHEYYFHCMDGREGLVDSALKTSCSGNLQRFLIKNLECLRVGYDYTIRDADCSVVQFHYGEDGVDPHSTSFLENFRALSLNQEALSEKFNVSRDFNTYIDHLPDGLNHKAQCFFKESSRADESLLMELLKQKYLSSLAPPGEPVGIIAAQTVGELSTQMTLNTFHLAGRGEMNVTSGVPRLQEILMATSNVIKTPVLTCPFLDFMSKADADSVVTKVKKISVADIIESIEVHKLPFQTSKYKLLVKYNCPEFVTLIDCKEILGLSFQTALEDAVENHVALLAEIRGRNAFKPFSEVGDVDNDSSGASDDDGNSIGMDTTMNGEDVQMVEAELVSSNSKSGESSKRKKRIVHMDIGSHIFECHFQFTNEPYMLLTQIAHRAAQEVYIEGSGKISDCKIVNYDANEKTVIWDDSKKSAINNGNNDDIKYRGMKAAGVDFIPPLWEMSEHLDVNRIYSNNIHAMLKTYGVEAARETIFRELKNVFGMYGVEVDFRHLSLIADYMTHDGGYQPMGRLGRMAESKSLLLRMSYDMSTKFITEAALHGMIDHMESPSARISLGLPVKIGTGSFDVMMQDDLGCDDASNEE